MNKHCMSVASLRVGTTLWFDQRWRGRVGMARRGRGGASGRGAHASGGGRQGLRARRKSASDFSFIIYFSNASDSVKVIDTSPEY